MIHHTTNCSSLIVLYALLYYYFITVKYVYIYLILFLFISFYFIYLFYLFSCQRITHMNSSGAVGDILVFTFSNLRDNTVYTDTVYADRLNKSYFDSVTELRN